MWSNTRNEGMTSYLSRPQGNSILLPGLQGSDPKRKCHKSETFHTTLNSHLDLKIRWESKDQLLLPIGISGSITPMGSVKDSYEKNAWSWIRSTFKVAMSNNIPYGLGRWRLFDKTMAHTSETCRALPEDPGNGIVLDAFISVVAPGKASTCSYSSCCPPALSIPLNTQIVPSCVDQKSFVPFSVVACLVL